MLNAMVWAPYFGSKLSGPITGTITKSTYVERFNYLLRLIRWLDARGFRVATRWLCFVEGVRHPSQPTQFGIGLINARPGSWLEKVFALEVFRFHNIQNCVQAYRVLRQHGIDPRPHVNHEVNIVLMSLEREVRPDPEVLALPKAENPARPLRNAQIKLFDGAPNPETAAREQSTEQAGIAEKQAPGRKVEKGNRNRYGRSRPQPPSSRLAAHALEPDLALY